MSHDIRTYIDKSFKISNFDQKRNIFLRKISSKNSNSMNKYVRMNVSPIRYAGGKSLAIGYVIEIIPEIKRLISPFFGGGSIEIALNKYFGVEVYGYDIFDILVNYWKIQIEQPNELYESLRKLNVCKGTYQRVRSLLKDHWEGKIKLNPMDLATYYFYNFNLSYGPQFLGWASEVYMNNGRYNAMMHRVKNFKPKKLHVECSSFEKVFEKFPNDFFYVDPPYYIGEDSKMFKGIYPQRNFPIHHEGFNHELLRDLLLKHKGGFILSYNDCPTIREYYKDFKQTFPSWQYTMGQGETRIGKNRLEAEMNHIKKSHEILICDIKNGE